jgi:hypothetical protein
MALYHENYYSVSVVFSFKWIVIIGFQSSILSEL